MSELGEFDERTRTNIDIAFGAIRRLLSDHGGRQFHRGTTHAGRRGVKTPPRGILFGWGGVRWFRPGVSPKGVGLLASSIKIADGQKLFCQSRLPRKLSRFRADPAALFLIQCERRSLRKTKLRA